MTTVEIALAFVIVYVTTVILFLRIGRPPSFLTASFSMSTLRDFLRLGNWRSGALYALVPLFISVMVVALLLSKL